MDFHPYFIEISIEFQLDFQWISIGISLKFQLDFHWYFNEISVEYQLYFQINFLEGICLMFITNINTSSKLIASNPFFKQKGHQK